MTSDRSRARHPPERTTPFVRSFFLAFRKRAFSLPSMRGPNSNPHQLRPNRSNEIAHAKRALDEKYGATPAKPFLGWHARGYLPHCDKPGLIQLVTFRLDDAMPAARRHEWELLQAVADERERRTKLEEYLDRGYGACHLRRPDIAALVENALQFFDAQRYRLCAWVVMPNHVHVLFEEWQTPMAEVLYSWKKYSAVEANQLLRRQGRFWRAFGACTRVYTRSISTERGATSNRTR